MATKGVARPVKGGANTARRPRAVRGATPRVIEVAWLHVASKALATAVKLDLFSAIDAEPDGATATAVADRAGVSERGARMVLDALCPSGIVRKLGHRYLLSDEARRTLVAGRDTYVGEQVLAIDAQRAAWDRLPEVVATGKPAFNVDQEGEAREFFPAVARRLYRGNLAVAERAAVELETLRLKPRRILDVAAGSGVWSIAVARRFPEALVTALDFAEVLPVTREFAAAAGVGDRFAYLEGNLREVDLGQASYDLVILGHILHSEGAARSRELVARAARALAPRGVCLVAEIIPDEARRERQLPLLFALNMLLRTSEGDVFTLPEITAWLRAAGFARVIPFAAGGNSPLVLGLMPGRSLGRTRR